MQQAGADTSISSAAFQKDTPVQHTLPCGSYLCLACRWQTALHCKTWLVG